MLLYYKFIRNFKGSLLGVCLMCGIAYFSYHAFSGNRGLVAWIDLTYRIEKAHFQLDNIRAERINLEHKVRMLRNESIDLDLLDEQSRRILGYAREDEIVIFTKDR